MCPIEQIMLLKDISEGDGDIPRQLGISRTDALGQRAGYFDRAFETLKQQSKGVLCKRHYHFFPRFCRP